MSQVIITQALLSPLLSTLQLLSVSRGFKGEGRPQEETAEENVTGYSNSRSVIHHAQSLRSSMSLYLPTAISRVFTEGRAQGEGTKEDCHRLYTSCRLVYIFISVLTFSFSLYLPTPMSRVYEEGRAPRRG